MDKQEFKVGDIVLHTPTKYVGKIVNMSYFHGFYVGDSPPPPAIVVKLKKEYALGSFNQLCALPEDLILHHG